MTIDAYLVEVRHSALHLAKRLQADGRTAEAVLMTLVEDFEESAAARQLSPADVASGHAAIAEAVREAYQGG
jgi:hypothetical protein